MVTVMLTSGRFCIPDIVVELAPLEPETVAGVFSPNLIFAFVIFANPQTKSAPFYDVLFGAEQKVFAIVSTFVEWPWKAAAKAVGSIAA